MWKYCLDHIYQFSEQKISHKLHKPILDFHVEEDEIIKLGSFRLEKIFGDFCELHFKF